MRRSSQPLAAPTSKMEFTLKPRSNQTEVTVTVAGDKNFMAKAFCLFMGMMFATLAPTGGGSVLYR